MVGGEVPTRTATGINPGAKNGAQSIGLAFSPPWMAFACPCRSLAGVPSGEGLRGRALRGEIIKKSPPPGGDFAFSIFGHLRADNTR